MSAIETETLARIIQIFIISISVLTLTIFLIITTIKYFQMKTQIILNQSALDQIKKENKTRTVEYTERTLDLIKMVIGQIVVLRFRTWRDERDMTLVAEPNLRDLAKECAIAANNSFNRENIVFDDAIFTETFFDEFVVETSFIMVKEIFERYINDLV